MTAAVKLAACLLLFLPGSALAQTAWTAVLMDPSGVPRDILTEGRSPSVGELPDGLISVSDSGTVAAAWYTHPTRRYAHGILGDAVEAGGLRVRLRDDKIVTLALPETEVFEDRYPRIADLDADGRMEIVTIRASVNAGAAVTVYGVRNDKLEQLATTPFIGTPNRWLNIAGIARFRGRDSREIAYVQTPHIGGTLIFVTFEKGELKPVARQYGFSNHWIGSPEMRLSAVADVNGDGLPDLAVPGADRGSLRLMTLQKSGLSQIASVPLPAAIDRAIAVQGTGRQTRFFVGLENGRVFRIERAR